MVNTDNEIAKRVCKDAEQEQSSRSNFDSLWEETRRRILPSATRFQGQDTPGERKTEWQFDSTAALAVERCAAVFIALNCPRSERYQTIQATERKIRKAIDVRQWCEGLRDNIFEMRYASASNFSSQLNEVLLARVSFGNGAMLIEDAPGRPTNYKSCPLPTSWWRESETGRVNWFLRKLEYTAAQSIEKFDRNGSKSLPDAIYDAAQNKPMQLFAFWHITAPNDKRNPRLRGPEGMGFTSHYVCETEKTLVESGGYRVFPFAVARATTNTNEKYGRGPAQTVLADIKMRNEMRKSILRSTNRMADPTLLVNDDTALMPFSLRPGFRNRGYINDEGVELAKQLEWKGDLSPALVLDQQTGEVIKDAMLIRVFEMMLANPNMTATEVLERLKERAILLTPDGAKFSDEFLGDLSAREIDIMSARGMLEDMPETLANAGSQVDMVPNSPLSRAQRAAEAVGFSRTVEQIAPLAETNPEILLQFKTEEILPDLAEIHGMPMNWLYTKDEFNEIRAALAKRKEQETAVAAAQPLATAAKDAAQARLLTQQAQ